MKNFHGKLKDIGHRAIEGLVNGIKEKWEALKGTIGNIADGIRQGFQERLDIHSPSRVMRDEVGKNLALGIGVGFENEIGDVEKDMINSLDVDGLVHNVNGAMKGLGAGIESSVNPNINPSITYESNYKMMASAMKDALNDMVVELDDKQVGSFVVNTISQEIYQ